MPNGHARARFLPLSRARSLSASEYTGTDAVDPHNKVTISASNIASDRITVPNKFSLFLISLRVPRVSRKSILDSPQDREETSCRCSSLLLRYQRYQSFVYGISTSIRQELQSTYVHPCISIHSSTHKSGYTHLRGAQTHTNLLGLVLRASATAASAPEVDAFVP